MGFPAKRRNRAPAPPAFASSASPASSGARCPRGTRVSFAPRPFNAYHLEVTERGYLHDLGLKTGDLVVAIDGAEFKDLAGMTAALNAAKTRETSKFTILRGAQTFDLTADGTKFEEDDGSYYSPRAR